MTSTSRSLEVPGLSHNAPIPLGAKVGSIICSSGISGKNAATGLLPPDAATQTKLAFANMQSLLEVGGAALTDVVKLTIYIKDNSLREAVNAEWLTCFPDPHDRPARHILIQDLQHGMLLQLEIMAVISSTKKD
ncbi:MAG: RidA family protein [Burkholderiaceae bacterium]|nr:RidA family protein [Burkholderiaceae bacterium]